jgi:hypothetical protein
MARKKRPSMYYIIFALVFASTIFFSGFGLGIFVNNLKAESLSASMLEASNNIKDTELELLLFNVMQGELSCDYLITKSYELGEQAGELGERVEVFEDFNDINSQDYNNLKKEYMRVLIKDWLVLEQIKQVCPSSYNIILYFYKDLEDCPDCLSQGMILSYYKNIMGQEVMVFGLDSSLDMSIINALETNYDINVYPSIIVNGQVHNGLVNTSVLGEILET